MNEVLSSLCTPFDHDASGSDGGCIGLAPRGLHGGMVTVSLASREFAVEWMPSSRRDLCLEDGWIVLCVLRCVADGATPGDRVCLFWTGCGSDFAWGRTRKNSAISRFLGI